MNKPFFAVVTATFATSLLGTPVQAQYYDNTGTAWNNGTSAILGTMINGMQQQSMMRSLMRSSYYGRSSSRRSRPTAAQLQERRGRALIKRGRATLNFKMRAAPAYLWLADWAKRNPNGRAGANAEWQEQSAIWREAVAARRAKYGDFAQMQSLAFLMCIEAYTGKKLSNGAFAKDLPGTRRVYLKSASFQGETLAQKQSDYESMMLSGSWAIYLRRHGRTDEARKTAKEWIDDHWDSDRKSVSDVDDAVATFAKFQSGPLPTPGARMASRPVTRAKAIPRVAVPVDSPQSDETGEGEGTSDAPPLSIEEANAIVQYKPVSSSVLPALLLKTTNDSASEQAEELKLFETILDAGRGKMRELFKPASSDKEDVADALSYAVIAMVTVSKSKSGKVSEAGFNNKNVQALTNHLTFALATNPDFAKQTPREKQQMAETAILLGTMVGVLNGDAQKSGDAKTRQRALDLARSSMQKLLGVSLDRVQVTPTEIVFGT